MKIQKIFWGLIIMTLRTRGHNLASKSNLTLEEELQLKLKELEQRNKYLEAEVGLLKKLKEIERRENLPE